MIIFAKNIFNDSKETQNRHLDEYNIFEGKIGNFFRNEKIKSICKIYGIRNYTINEDGSLDVDGDVDLYCDGLAKLLLKFNRVTGSFYCEGNNLTSLENCPKYVGRSFTCGKNRLTSLEGCPKYVGGNFHCQENKLTSLEGCPEHVGDVFHCGNNPIHSVVKYFIYYKDRDNIIELFNYYDIVQDMNVIYDRLKFFYEGIGINVTNHNMLKEIEEKGYKIIY